MADNLEQQILALEDMERRELAERWETLTARPVPLVSLAVLRMAVAWEMQAARYGGLSRRSSQTLDQLVSGHSQTQRLQPGMRLAREYGGRMHVVTVDETGAIVWNDRQWKSLSAVARAITGTHWSGPAFFGLKQRQLAA